MPHSLVQASSQCSLIYFGQGTFLFHICVSKCFQIPDVQIAVQEDIWICSYIQYCKREFQLHSFCAFLNCIRSGLLYQGDIGNQLYTRHLNDKNLESGQQKQNTGGEGFQLVVFCIYEQRDVCVTWSYDHVFVHNLASKQSERYCSREERCSYFTFG